MGQSFKKHVSVSKWTENDCEDFTNRPYDMILSIWIFGLIVIFQNRQYLVNLYLQR